MKGRSGQALVEFAYFSVFSATFVGLAGLILKEEWNRSKCAYLVFEQTHNYLIRRDSMGRGELPLNELDLSGASNRGFSLHFHELSHQIAGTGQCGSHIEEVRLPLLETAKW